jgi:hypothetical protein
MALAIHYPYAILDQGTQGVGDDARSVAKALVSVEKSFARSFFFSGNSQTALAELNDLAAKAVVDDWDGEGGKKYSQASYRQTAQMLKKMPWDWPSPEIDLDSDGDFSMHWNGGPARRVTLSIGADKLSYAWMNPNPRCIERNYGVAEANGAFPATISEAISRLNA